MVWIDSYVVKVNGPGDFSEEKNQTNQQEITPQTVVISFYRWVHCNLMFREHIVICFYNVITVFLQVAYVCSFNIALYGI